MEKGEAENGKMKRKKPPMCDVKGSFLLAVAVVLLLDLRVRVAYVLARNKCASFVAGGVVGRNREKYKT